MATFSMATREWKDGLLSTVMRNIGAIPDELPKWIMLDGDLDANWIESMNSVMDDNRMLTLRDSVLKMNSELDVWSMAPSTRCRPRPSLGGLCREFRRRRRSTQASNERIPLKPHMRMVFEIRDLKHATPATVSRAGILYISTNQGTQWSS